MIEGGKIEGDLVLRGYLQLEGMVTGSVTVGMGCRLDLGGMIVGDLVVEEGGQALVRGMIGGDLINRGGIVRIDGTILGNLLPEPGPNQGGGQTEISSGANIAGHVVD
jgi:cytoskeletal protein CcmA (bactofilin family)